MSLSKSEEVFRHIFDDADDGMAYMDTTGKILEANKSVARVLGKPKGDLLGKHFSDVCAASPEEKSNAERAFRQALTGKKILLNLHFKDEKGEEVDFECLPSLIKSGNRISGVMTIMRNVTERKRTEESLRKRTHDLRERVKELNCLFGVSKCLTETDVSDDEVLQNTVGLIPDGWHYPDITCARIRYEDRQFVTRNFRETEWKQVTDIEVSGDKSGTVEVYYLEERPPFHEGPFLKEERDLIDALAREIGEYVERASFLNAVQESEKRLRSILESSPDAITVADLNGEIVDCNQEALNLHGFSSKGELIGKSALDLIAKDNRRRAAKNVENALKVGPAKNVESVCLTKDGREFPAEISASVLRDASGNPTHFIGITKDITKRKEAEEELRRSEERFRTLFEFAPDACVLFDAEGNFVDGNKAAEKLLGYTLEEVLGRNLFDLGVFSPEDIECVLENLMKTVNGQPSGPDEFVLKRKDGDRISVETRTLPMNIEGRDMIYAIARDITLRKQAEEAKVGLISNISHELRTPLTSIHGYVRVLLSGKMGEFSEEQKKALEVIAEESDRLRGLIDSFLDLMTIDAEGLKMDVNEISLSQVIDSLMSSMEMELEKKEVSLSKDFSPDLDPIMGNEAKLRQALSNLLDNAIKFTSSGGAIQITAKRDDKAVVVEVADTGIGIIPEDLPHVFERFYQADSSSTRGFGGAGLGLAICKEIVEAHGGRIEVESEIGKGSVFRVVLPLGKEVIDG
ncbi:MAG: PAS domain S-box protein [Candidatus Thermoplasmatota archaeon]|nr:PAS domain S-box protein [Candidatus Thermoplasmatota archaeon]